MEIVVKALRLSLADFFEVDSDVFCSLSPDGLFHFFKFSIRYYINTKFFIERLYAIKMDVIRRLIRQR